MLSIRLVFVVVLALVCQYQLTDAGLLNPTGPQCLMNSCQNKLGLISLYCNSACILAGYESGTCSTTDGNSQGRCVCNGASSTPDYSTVPTVCAATCVPGCELCGFNGPTSTCTVSEGDVTCNCGQ